jgi:hypothetical protein
LPDEAATQRLGEMLAPLLKPVASPKVDEPMRRLMGNLNMRAIHCWFCISM